MLAGRARSCSYGLLITHFVLFDPFADSDSTKLRLVISFLLLILGGSRRPERRSGPVRASKGASPSLKFTLFCRFVYLNSV